MKPELPSNRPIICRAADPCLDCSVETGFSGGSQSFVLVSKQANSFIGHVAEDVEGGGKS